MCEPINADDEVCGIRGMLLKRFCTGSSLIVF